MYAFYYIIMLAGGIYCIFCAYKDYDWFMNSSKAWLIVKLFGREGARKFYIGLGIVIILLTLAVAFGGSAIFAVNE